MFRTLSLICILTSLNSAGQVSKLKLEIFPPYQSSWCFNVAVTSGPDTLLKDIFFSDYQKVLDSLKPGDYKMHIYDCNAAKPNALIKYFRLRPYKITSFTIDLAVDQTVSDMDTLTRQEIVKQRGEGQINISYFNNDWLNSPSYIKSNYAIGFSGYQWYAFSKHFGFLAGGGLGLSQHMFSNDTTFINAPQFKKNYEYYTYLNAHLDVKLRISSANQQRQFGFPTKLFLDVGCIYNAPIFFKHIVRYNDNKKITNGALHQFTDVRVFANLGYSHFAFFAEHRLLDFIIGNYPELPAYNAGIRLFIN